MTLDPTLTDDRPLWRAARAALARGDLQQADALFLKQFSLARNDADVLADYGAFCLRTRRAAGARYLLHRALAMRPGDIQTRSHLGYAHLELKEFRAARVHFEAVLAISPGHAPSNHGLALCLREEGDYVAAAKAIEKALAAVSANDALPLLVHLAEACHRTGDDAKARRYFARALALAPDHPAVMLAWGTFLRECGEPAQAMDIIDRCAQQDPDEPRLILEKARCLRLLGDPGQALQRLDRLGQLAPRMPEGAEEAGLCMFALGKAAAGEERWTKAIEGWLQAGDHASAEALLDRLLAANPLSAAGWNARGTLANARRRFDAAEAAWRQAFACDPSLLAASANLALLLENANRLADARTAGEQALPHVLHGVQQGSAAGLLLALARVARRQRDYAASASLVERSEAASPTDVHLSAAAIERGKLMDALDRPADAIAAFTAGNAAAAREWRRAHPAKSPMIAGLDQMLDLVGKGWLRELPPIADLPAHRDLAFLIGFPRSGTTLLNQVLDGHPAIQTMDELPPISRLVEAFRDIPRGYPFALADIDALDVGWLRETYLRSAAMHTALAPEKLLLDKYPISTTVAGMLHRIFPQARFVFALRHPCDVVLSCFMQSFEPSTTNANFFTLADSVALYTRTMDLWQCYREQLPLQAHVVRYEDVVDDFDGQVAALCRFLGVPWQDDLRDFPTKALARTRISTPSYEQVSRPIYREARFRWHRYREHLEPFLPALRPYIERFGYSE